MVPQRLQFALLFALSLFISSCHGFLCLNGETLCRPYSDEVYSKDCPSGFNKCSNLASLSWHKHAHQKRFEVVETYYQSFSQDPCIPQAKVSDGHVDCPHRDDEKDFVYKCTATQMSCPIKDGGTTYLFPNNMCFNHQLFCDITIDQNCERACQLKKETLMNVTVASEKVDCEVDLEFDCGEFCIPKSWQHDFQIDCANRKDEIGAPESIFKCHGDEHKCQNEAKCIHKQFVCDGEVDCLGATDEFDCSRECPNKLHKCANGQCITQDLTCDFVFDCFDKSDEDGCTSVNHRVDNTVSCSTLHVGISKNMVCDGNKDCPNGSDEDGCNISPMCDSFHFQCKDDNMCVPKPYMCDGVKDCHDGSDELGCPKKETTCQAPLKLCQDGSCQDHCRDDVCGPKKFLLPNGKCGSIHRFCPEHYPVEKVDGEWKCDDFRNEIYYKCDPKDELCAKSSVNCCATVLEYYQCKYGYSNRFKRGCELDNLPIEANYCSHEDHYCYPGFYVLENGELLIEGKENAKILMTTLNQVLLYDIMSGVALPLMNLSSISASYYWMEKELFFWADSSKRAIMHCELALYVTSPYEHCADTTFELLSDVLTHSIAFDWVHELLYFADDEELSMNVVKWNFPSRKILFRGSFQSFRNIQVDPSLGLVYYVASGMLHSFHVGSSDAFSNGKEEQEIHREPVPFAVSSFYFDFHSKLFYYGTPKYGGIFSVANGVQKQHYISRELFNPIHSIALFGEQLFWSDKDGLYTFNGSNLNADAIRVAPGVGRPIQLQVIHRSVQPPFTDKCDGHVCDQICLPISWFFQKRDNLTHVCACADGFVLFGAKCIYDESALVTSPPEESTTVRVVTTTKASPTKPMESKRGSPVLPTDASDTSKAKKEESSSHGLLITFLIVVFLVGSAAVAYYYTRRASTPATVNNFMVTFSKSADTSQLLNRNEEDDSGN